MQTKHLNLEEWLHREAHVAIGHAFQTGECACVPVVPEAPQKEGDPVGFLITHGQDVSFIDVNTPEGANLLCAYNKAKIQEMVSEQLNLPSEYWYG